MNLKSITFRCSAAQVKRLQSAMQTRNPASRTALIASALEAFLAFVEQKDIAALNLFELVDRVDDTGSKERFARQV
ncbi:MAG: hypothetical protein Q4F38_06825 [Akkermansia sp.]|nr:hypothetical protein [Akkermansia sp.]